jgi:ATP-dependent DNA helicase RecG
MARTDLELQDVILLDKVQKQRSIPEEAFRSLRKQGLVEGRKVAPFISAAVAEVTEQEAEYLRKRGMNKDDCKRKVIDYLTQFDRAALNKFLELLEPYLSTVLTDDQKKRFVRNLLQEMRQDGTIRSTVKKTKGADWELTKPGPDRGSFPQSSQFQV